MRAPPEALTVISAACALAGPVGGAGDLFADDAAHAGAHEAEVEHDDLERHPVERGAPADSGFALAGLRAATSRRSA